MLINLKVLVPFQVFLERKDVKRIVAQTFQGSIGLLPRRRDCTTAPPPGILTYETETEGEVYVAVDQGVLGSKLGRKYWSPYAMRSGGQTSTHFMKR